MRERRSGRSRALRAALVVVCVVGLLAVAPAGVLAQSANGTNATNGTNASAAPAAGAPIQSSCGEVRNDLDGSDIAPNYRVVTGSCSITLSGGDRLSNVWFQAGDFDIQARGSGWAIENVAITDHNGGEDAAMTLQVNERQGVGSVYNVYIQDTSSNAVFVHPYHAGTIRFEKFTTVGTTEDAVYGSRPGNPVNSPVGGLDGESGVVGFDQAFIKDVTGDSAEVGYGIRLGSDGSYVTNSTIVGVSGAAASNTFAGGEHPNRFSGTSGVTFRNVDIVTDGIGIRMGTHQDRYDGQGPWTPITTMQNVRINADEPVQQNPEAGQLPIIRGGYSSGNADPSPPPGAPGSPQAAASGVGGNSGSIGGPIDGGGGLLSGLIVQAGQLVLIITGIVVVSALGVAGLTVMFVFFGGLLVGKLKDALVASFLEDTDPDEAENGDKK